jgi:hypothetical protein
VDPPQKVSAFIDTATLTLDEAKLRQFMLPMDVEKILEIPLGTRRYEDEWAWHYEHKGVFSIRSAYNMLVNMREKREAWLDGRASCSNGKVVEKQWSLLWHTLVPSKIKFSSGGSPSNLCR